MRAFGPGGVVGHGLPSGSLPLPFGSDRGTHGPLHSIARRCSSSRRLPYRASAVGMRGEKRSLRSRLNGNEGAWAVRSEGSPVALIRILISKCARGRSVPRVAVLRNPCRGAFVGARVSEYRDPWHYASAHVGIRIRVRGSTSRVLAEGEDPDLSASRASAKLGRVRAVAFGSDAGSFRRGGVQWAGRRGRVAGGGGSSNGASAEAVQRLVGVPAPPASRPSSPTL